MSDCKDNVKVVIRIRPISSRESAEGEIRKCVTAQVHKNSVAVDMKPEAKVFTYDFVADEDISQDQMFQVVGKPIATACLSGYNGTIFAYGQTGAGKTFTINGPEDGLEPDGRYDIRGILPRCVEFIFSSITKEMKKPGVEFLVKCSFLEIYQEQVMDLLGETGSLQLREDMKRGVYVEGLVEQTVLSVAQALDLIREGTRNRHVGATSMNKESSRSHSVFTMIIESKETFTSALNFKTSCFHLIDLAGSERQKATDATGDRLKEAGMINKSLSALGNVINSLVEVAEGRSRHVHYRDSKLTFLLKDSLGGNAKTCIIANISPSIAAFGETLSTLKFAQRAKLIKNKAVINEDTSGNIAVLKEEIRRLKAELAASQEGHSTSAGTDYSLLILNDRVKQLEALLEHNVRIRQETETVLQREIVKKEEQLDLLTTTVSKYDKKLSHDKMIIKLREATIARLQSGQPPAVSETTQALEREVESLKELVDAHPQAAKLFAENERLKQGVEELRGELGCDPFSLTYRLKENQEFTQRLAASLQESVMEREQLKAMLAEYEKYKTGELFPSPERRRREEELTRIKLEYCERIDRLSQELMEERRRRAELEGSQPMVIEGEESLVERKLRALEAEMEPVQSSFYLLAPEEDDRTTALEQQLAAVRDVLEHKEVENLQLRQDLDVLTEANTFLQNQLQEVRQALEDRKSTCFHLQSTLETLQAEQTHKEDLLMSLQSTSEGSPLYVALQESRRLAQENGELRSELQQRLSEYGKAVETLRLQAGKLESAESREQTDKAGLADWQRKAMQYRTQMTGIEADLQGAREELRVYEEEQRKLTEQNQSLLAACNQQQLEADSLRSLLEQTRTALAQTQTELEHHNSQEQGTIASLTEQLHECQTLIEEMQTENEALQRENSDLKNGFQQESRRKSWFSELDTSSQCSFEALRAEMSVLKEENENSQARALRNTSRLSKPEADLWRKTLEEKNALIASLRQQLADRAEDFTHANQLIAKFSLAFSGTRKAEDYEEEINTLKSTLSAKEAELREAKEYKAWELSETQRKEMDGIAKKAALLQGDLVRIKEELRVSVQSRESLIEEMKRARSEQSLLAKDCEELRDSLRRAQAERAKAYKDIEALTKENEKLVGHNNMSQKIRFHGRVKEENNQLKTQNFKLAEDLQRVQSRCDLYQRVSSRQKLEEMRRKAGLPALEVDTEDTGHTEKLQAEIRNLSDGLTRISDFVFNLPIVTLTPMETNIVDSTIRAISGLYDALEAREAELQARSRELSNKTSKLSILENEQLLWRQKLELQQLRTPASKSRLSTPGHD